MSTKFTFLPWFNCLKRSVILFVAANEKRQNEIYSRSRRGIWREKWKTHALKSGLNSGCSAQHCRMMLIASGGAAPFDTDGRISGGGFLIFEMISSADSDNMQYGSPRTTTSCMIIPNEKTSPAWVPHFEWPFELRSNSGAVHSNSVVRRMTRKKRRIRMTWWQFLFVLVFQTYVWHFSVAMVCLAPRRIDWVRNRLFWVPNVRRPHNFVTSANRERATVTNVNIAYHAPNPSTNSTETTNLI